jgi:uncharacterized membrane protein YeaQ/YmgE (transglycosylase-associated protein family)
MGIFAWIILGLIAGAIARAIAPGGARLGCCATTIVGIAGALIGGAIASAAGVGHLHGFFDFGTWALAIIGSVILLLLLEALSRGRR